MSCPRRFDNMIFFKILRTFGIPNQFLKRSSGLGLRPDFMFRPHFAARWTVENQNNEDVRCDETKTKQYYLQFLPFFSAEHQE